MSSNGILVFLYKASAFYKGPTLSTSKKANNRYLNIERKKVAFDVKVNEFK